MEQMKVSVIVPVYNVADYLRKCMNSIINQSYSYLEIILVDDGSTDGSEVICDEYAANDSRIRIIHKKNGGLSEARNVGIDAATGEYISFIDSDDFVSPFFIEIMLNALVVNDADLSMVKKEIAFWDGEQQEDAVPILKEKYGNLKVDVLNTHDALERMLYQNINTGAPFKFIRRDILDGIRFPVGWLYEDMATTYKYIQNSKRIAVVDAPIYAYRKRMNSIIRQGFDNRKLIMLTVMEKVEKDILTFDPSLKQAVYARSFSNMYTIFLQVPETEKDTRDMLWEKIKGYRKQVLLDFSPYIRRKDKIGALISYCGKNTAYHIGCKFGQKGTMYK